jgi:hypothetical protein
MGKRALISGTGTGSILPAAMVAPGTSLEAAMEANWTLGTDTNPSSKVLAIASSSSVVGLDGVLEVA